MTNKRRWIATGTIGSVVAVLACACGGHAPTTPSGLTTPSGPPTPSGPALAISGTVTGYRGGPLSGAKVLAEAFADPGPMQWPAKQTTTQTDSQGRYTLSTISAGHVGLVVSTDGYVTAWKANLSSQNSI